MAAAGPRGVGQWTRPQLRSWKPPGPKKKAQVTSFNSGVGTLGPALGVGLGWPGLGRRAEGDRGGPIFGIGWGPGSVGHGASHTSLLSLWDPGEPGALCLTLLTPREGCQSLLPGTLPGYSRHALVPGEVREAPLPPGPPSPAPIPGSLWGTGPPQTSMQIPSLQPRCSGRTSLEVEAGAAHPGHWATGCTHISAEPRHEPHPRTPATLPAPTLVWGSSSPIPRSPERWQLQYKGHRSEVRGTSSDSPAPCLGEASAQRQGMHRVAQGSCPPHL